MFSDYEPPEALKEALFQAAIVAADLNPAARTVSVVVHSDAYIPQRLLDQAAKEICEAYGLNRMELTATHPADQLHNVESEELMNLFVRQNSMARGSLAGAKWSWDENTLTVHLLANGKKELEESVPVVQRILQERFATPVSIHIEAGKTL